MTSELALATLLASPTTATVPSTGVTKPRLNLLSIPGAACDAAVGARALKINGGASWATSRSVT